MQRAIAAILCTTLLCSGCASAAGGRIGSTPVADQRVDPALLASYVKQLRIGSRVRVDLVGGHRIKGTLMKADDQGIVLQRRTRITEPPVQIAIDRIGAVELDANGNLGRSVGIGIAAGAAGALSAFLILVAIFAGD